jgi:UDP-N-acetylmuramate dehydrogenase
VSEQTLANFTSIKIGGVAADFYAPTTLAELQALLVQRGAVRFFAGGNNVVFGATVSAPLISLRNLNPAMYAVKIASADEIEIKVGAGFPLPQWVSETTNVGWSGAEGLAGIPGTVGGAIAMNAGTAHGEIADCLVEIDALQLTPTPHEVILTAKELHFAYRYSRLQEGGMIVTAAVFRLRRSGAENLRRRVEENLAARTSRLIKFPNCGSVFKNPAPEIRAGKLLAAAGLKGVQRGKLRVSPQHANFFENLGGATPADFFALLLRAQTAVENHAGIKLLPEVKIIADEFPAPL